MPSLSQYLLICLFILLPVTRETSCKYLSNISFVKCGIGNSVLTVVPTISGLPSIVPGLNPNRYSYSPKLILLSTNPDCKLSYPISLHNPERFCAAQRVPVPFPNADAI